MSIKTYVNCFSVESGKNAERNKNTTNIHASCKWPLQLNRTAHVVMTLDGCYRTNSLIMLTSSLALAFCLHRSDRIESIRPRQHATVFSGYLKLAKTSNVYSKSLTNRNHSRKYTCIGICCNATQCAINMRIK